MTFDFFLHSFMLFFCVFCIEKQKWNCTNKSHLEQAMYVYDIEIKYVEDE